MIIRLNVNVVFVCFRHVQLVKRKFRNPRRVRASMHHSYRKPTTSRTTSTILICHKYLE